MVVIIFNGKKGKKLLKNLNKMFNVTSFNSCAKWPNDLKAAEKLQKQSVIGCTLHV